jgi:hypothetical protein
VQPTRAPAALADRSANSRLISRKSPAADHRPRPRRHGGNRGRRRAAGRQLPRSLIRTGPSRKNDGPGDFSIPAVAAAEPAA